MVKQVIIFSSVMAFLIVLTAIGSPTAAKEKWLWASYVGIFTFGIIILVFSYFS